MILAIGYRVRNNIGIHFRNWSSSVLSEYMKKGFVLNDERLKIQKIWFRLLRWTSWTYQRYSFFWKTCLFKGSWHICYICWLWSTLWTGRSFFKTVQNKLHYSVHGHTAPELIVERADASKKYGSYFIQRCESKEIWYNHCQKLFNSGRTWKFKQNCHHVSWLCRRSG